MTHLLHTIANFIALVIDKITYQLTMAKHRPRLSWHKSFIRKDEFDKSLDMDGYALIDMNKEDRVTYLNDLSRRRRIAHERDMQQDDDLLKKKLL